MEKIRFRLRFVSAQAFFLAVLMLFPMPLCAENNGSVSGTVYQSDGTTLFTENVIYIEAIPDADPCGEWDIMGSSLTNLSDGTYTIENLPPGTYHLRTSIAELNYANEWWTASGSVTDCSASQSVSVGSGESVSGKNFQLDAGATISGTVSQGDGITPFTEGSVYIDVISDGACGQKSVAWADTNSADGTYTLVGLPPGTYHLRTSISELNYVNEWWAESASVTDCGKAQSVTAISGTEISKKDFQIATLSEGDINGGGTIGLDDVRIVTGLEASGIYTDAVTNEDSKIGMGDLVYILGVLSKQP